MKGLLKYALEPISQDLERELIQKAQADNQESDAAVDTLLRSNIKLLYKLAREFQPCALSVEELVTEGSTGLTYAISKFDLERDVRFISYACWWIRQKMRLAIQNQSSTVRMPGSMAVIRAKVLRAKDELQEALGHEPTTEELSEYTELAPDQVRTALYSLSYDVRNDFSEEDENKEPDFEDLKFDSFGSLYKAETMEALKKAWESLNSRDRYILTLRYGLDGAYPKTLEETAQEVGRTRERVRQLQGVALAKLKRKLEKHSI